jgi:hypothetical protein
MLYSLYFVSEDGIETTAFNAGLVLFGACMLPLIPLCFQLGCELTFELNSKIGEGNVVGIIFLFGKVPPAYLFLAIWGGILRSFQLCVPRLLVDRAQRNRAGLSRFLYDELRGRGNAKPRE